MPVPTMTDSVCGILKRSSPQQVACVIVPWIAIIVSNLAASGPGSAKRFQYQDVNGHRPGSGDVDVAVTSSGVEVWLKDDAFKSATTPGVVNNQTGLAPDATMRRNLVLVVPDCGPPPLLPTLRRTLRGDS